MDIRTLEGGVFCITLKSHSNAKGDFENRFDLQTVRALNDALDVALRENARAVVVTGGEQGKFFSNGHDVAWLEQRFDSGEADVFIREFYNLLGRIMSFPLPTVAAVNGHAFAGGCLLALAQDYRVMKVDKGFICMNEIDMVPAKPSGTLSKIVPGSFKLADRKMMSVLNVKLSPQLVRDMFLRGVRFTGAAAKQAGLVDATSDGDVVGTAVELARSLGSKAHPANRRTFSVLKFEQYRDAIDILTEGASEELHTRTLSRL